MLVDTLKGDIYYVSGYDIIVNDNKTGVALLVKKDYYFMKVAIENLLVSTTTTEIVKTANNRKISIVFAYIRCSYYTERLETWKSWAKYLIFHADVNTRHILYSDSSPFHTN